MEFGLDSLVNVSELITAMYRQWPALDPLLYNEAFVSRVLHLVTELCNSADQNLINYPLWVLTEYSAQEFSERQH